jgi:hypothetical protein
VQEEKEVAVKDNLKEPCKECPFRKTSLKGWLGGELTAKQTHDMVLGEADFACHKTRSKPLDKMSRCKGSQIFLLNHCKLPKFNQPLAKALKQTEREGHKENDYLGFDFIEHHEGGYKRKQK